MPKGKCGERSPERSVSDGLTDGDTIVRLPDNRKQDGEQISAKVCASGSTKVCPRWREASEGQKNTEQERELTMKTTKSPLILSAFALWTTTAFAQTAPATGPASGSADLQADKADIKADKSQHQADRAAVKQDKVTLAADKAAGNTAAVKADRAQLRVDRTKAKAEKADLTADRQDARADRAERRADRAERRAERAQRHQN